MRTILTILLVLGISGCGVTLEGWEISIAENNCAAHGGIGKIYYDGGVNAICNDGSQFRIKYIKRETPEVE